MPIFEKGGSASTSAVPTADSTLWTPSVSAATDKTCIKIEYEKAVTEGMVNSGKEYFVTFVNVM